MLPIVRREFLQSVVQQGGCALSTMLLSNQLLQGQEKQPENLPPAPAGFRLFEPKTYRVTFTIEVTAPRGALSKVFATGPLPLEWPEQQLKFLNEQKPNGVRTRVVTFPGQAASLAVTMGGIPAGRTAAIHRSYEFTRYRLKFVKDPTELSIPKKLTPELRWHLTGAPGIDIRTAEVVTLAKSLQDDKLSAWKQVRAIYDWVRGNLTYQEGIFLGAAKTLQGKTGDCEDFTALFVTLCRLMKIPARSVWIEGHAYPEFYLVDADNQGYWIPAEMTGPLWFGEAGQYGPILQKGDRFRDPIARRDVRYVPQSARAFGGAAQLKCTRTVDLTQKNPL